MQFTYLSCLSASNRALHEAAERETKMISSTAIQPVAFQNNRGKKLMAIEKRKTCYLSTRLAQTCPSDDHRYGRKLLGNHQHLDRFK